MFIQALAEVDEGAECFGEIKSIIGAIYLVQFRNPNVYSFMSNPTIPAYQGVDDPTSSLRRILRNMVRCGDFCQEMVNAARVDSDAVVAEALWEIVVSCTWDPSVLESVGTMRPYASQMKLLVQLMECESCRKLLSPVQLARCRRYAKVHSRTSVTSVLSRCSLEYPDRTSAESCPSQEQDLHVSSRGLCWITTTATLGSTWSTMHCLTLLRLSSGLGMSLPYPQEQTLQMHPRDMLGVVLGSATMICTLVDHGRVEMSQRFQKGSLTSLTLHTGVYL